MEIEKTAFAGSIILPIFRRGVSATGGDRLVSYGASARASQLMAACEFIFHVLGPIADFEQRLNGERTRDGLAAAKAKGRKAGRPPIDPDKQDAAIKLIEAGLSPTKAARQVGLGRATVYKHVTARTPIK